MTQQPLAVMWGSRLREIRLAAPLAEAEQAHRNLYANGLSDGRRARIINGPLTQAELAHRCGSTQHTISRLEKGEHLPNEFLKMQLAAAFGMPVEQLFPYPSLDAVAV